MFAQLMMGTYPEPNSQKYSILEAWTWAARYTWESYERDEDIYTAVIFDSYSKDDYLPGWGGFSPSLSHFQEYNKTLVGEKNTKTGLTVKSTRFLESTIGKYSISTEVPQTSDKVMIYFSEKPSYSSEWVSSLAKKLGMSGEIRETPEAYFASSADEKDNIFVVHKDARVIVFTKRNAGSSGDLTDEKAIASVKEFLKSTDLMPSDALEPSVAYNTGEGLSPSGEIQKGWKQVVVTFPRQLNGVMVWNSQLMVTVDSQGNVVDLFMNWRDYKPYKEAFLKSPEKAFEEFQEKSIVSGKSPDKITVNSVSLVYTEPPAASKEKYLRPIYVLDGMVQSSVGRTESFEPVIITASQEVPMKEISPTPINKTELTYDITKNITTSVTAEVTASQIITIPPTSSTIESTIDKSLSAEDIANKAANDLVPSSKLNSTATILSNMTMNNESISENMIVDVQSGV